MVGAVSVLATSDKAMVRARVQQRISSYSNSSCKHTVTLIRDGHTYVRTYIRTCSQDAIRSNSVCYTPRSTAYAACSLIGCKASRKHWRIVADQHGQGQVTRSSRDSVNMFGSVSCTSFLPSMSSQCP